MNFLHSKYGLTIQLDMTLHLIKVLGSNFDPQLHRSYITTAMSGTMSNLTQFVATMLQDIYPFVVSFTGFDMQTTVRGAGLLQDPDVAEIVLCVPDEANFGCHNGVKENWCLPCHGTPKSKTEAHRECYLHTHAARSGYFATL